MIKSNKELQEYFAQSQTWSANIYSHAVIWRNWSLVIAILSLIIAMITLATLVKLLPLKENTPYLVFIDHKHGEPVAIRPVVDKEFVENEQLKKYMIRKFLLARERYNPDTLSEDDEIVSSLAVQSVYKDYVQYISQFTNDNTINLDKIIISFLNEQRAYISFVIRVNNAGIIKEYPANAQIKFQFTDKPVQMDVVHKINPVNFEVLNYQSHYQVNSEVVL